MQLIYVYTKLKYDGHRSLIVAKNKPNWFERLVLGKQTEILHFVGHGSRWSKRGIKHVTPIQPTTRYNRSLLERLEKIEGGVIQDHRFAKGNGHLKKAAAIK